MKKIILIICVLAMVFGCGKEDKKDSGSLQDSLPAGSKRYTPVVDAVKRIEDSVVNIRTEKIITTSIGPSGDETLHGENYINDFFGHNRTYKTQSLGSGFIVEDDGIIITNYHVIESASKIYVLLNDNSVYEAKLLGGDNIIDLAVLKILKADRKFPTAALGDSDKALLGESVIAMGNPYGLNSSITTGVISSVRRIIHIGLGYSVFMQTDALINPGNSGGPLVNMDGEVIGINSAMVQQAQGICFSIPINTAMRILPEILKTGKVRMGYMGISVTETKDDNGIHLVITSVGKDSNAEKIGIKANDIILQVNGIPISSLLAMSNMLRSYPTGAPVSMIIERGTKTFKGQVLMADYPENYGINLLRSNYGLDFAVENNLMTIIKSTESDSVMVGDILVAVNDSEVKSLEELNDFVMDNLGRQITFTIYRKGTLLRLKVQI
ncbi:MAG: trypsin-like peptidase domain-containing protein [Deferribacterales bacterium]